MSLAFLTASVLNGQTLFEQRLEKKDLKKTLMGALLHLDDSQIRERQGRGSPEFDACDLGDGCFPTPIGSPMTPMLFKLTRNLAGEWANFINIYPERFPKPFSSQGMIQLQDSNMFMTAAVSYPLHFFDESALEENEQVLASILKLSTANLANFSNDRGFTFWPKQEGTSSEAERVGPLNIPMFAGRGIEFLKLIPFKEENQFTKEWLLDTLDRQKNPYGVDALANIPADADDTAVALAHFQVFGPEQAPIELSTLSQSLLSWRDLGRSKEDGRDQWKEGESGAFLTWLKDENLDRDHRFLEPELGVMPLGVNNVDCVVNANVLFALGLAKLGREADESITASSQLMLKAAAGKHWPQCGLYYPQKMLFPYAISRAYRDGGVDNPYMEQAMVLILSDLISEQEASGAFDGGADQSKDLATALAVVSLLNIGKDIAEPLQLGRLYEEAIDKGIAYLVRQAKSKPIKHRDTFNRNQLLNFLPPYGRNASTWESGLYFSASNWDLAQWRSSAYTSSMVVEAIAKYLLAYDQGSAGQAGSKLKVLSYARSTREADSSFQVIVR
ncbi:MAG: hypothetical protein HRU09_14725 [Oligoflexales bacterium]|nr:hypothetical protein [Oligoflexales bacterium]